VLRLPGGSLPGTLLGKLPGKEPLNPVVFFVSATIIAIVALAALIAPDLVKSASGAAVARPPIPGSTPRPCWSRWPGGTCPVRSNCPRRWPMTETPRMPTVTSRPRPFVQQRPAHLPHGSHAAVAAHGPSLWLLELSDP